MSEKNNLYNILPINTGSLSRLYNTHILTTTLMPEELFLSNYIQMKYSPQDRDISLDYYPDAYAFSGWPSMKVYDVDESVSDLGGREFIDKLIYWLDKGFYISILLPEILIPGTQLYNNDIPVENINIYLHDILIFGYDRSKEIFLTRGLDERVNLSTIEVSFSDLNKAYNSEEYKNAFNYKSIHYHSPELFDLRLYKAVSDGHAVRFNLERVKTHLKHYLNSENSAGFAYFDEPCDEVYWGLDIYKKISSQIEAGELVYDYRIFYGIAEHKVLMKERIDYMIREGIIKDFPYFEELDTLAGDCNMLKLYSLKMRASLKTTNIKGMNELIRKIYEEDKAFTSKFIEYLEQF